MSGSLKDLKTASSARQQDKPEPTPAPAPVALPAAVSEQTKLLGARVPVSIHREFQMQLFQAQERVPNLTQQQALPALVRMLRDPIIFRRFLDELEQDR